MDKIKILHIISDTNFGGAGRLLLNLSQCIDKKRFMFTFAIPYQSKLQEKLEQEGRVYCYYGKGDASFDPNSIYSLCKIIKNAKPHIVHTHSSLSGRIAAVICGIKKQRIIYTKHCVFGTPSYYKYKMCRKIYKFIDNALCGHIIAVADSAKEKLTERGVTPSKIKVIINGSLPLKKYSDEEITLTKSKLGITDQDFVVGLVARLENYKGHRTLIKVAKIASNTNNHIKFIFIGDGSIKKDLIDFTRQLGVDDKIIFTGFVDNVAEYMNTFDLNVNCSIGTETSCLAISEGLSIGIPIVATDFGGNTNMVIQGQTGYIFPQNDHNGLYKIINNICIISSLRS